MRAYKIGQIYLAYLGSIRLARINITPEFYNVISHSSGHHIYMNNMFVYSSKDRRPVREVLLENECV